MTIETRGGEIRLDYTGTDPQTVGFVNAPYASSFSAILLTLLMLVDPDLPHNEGILRPIHVDIPPVVAHVTQFNVHIGTCSVCGHRFQGRSPHSK